MPLPGNPRAIRLLANLYLARFSPSDIDRVARTPVRIGVAGDAALLGRFRRQVALDRVADDEPFPSLSLHALPPEEKRNHWHVIDDCQIVVVLLGRDQLLDDTIYRVHEALPKKVTAVWAGVGEVEPWLRGEIADIAADLRIGAFIFVDALEGEAATPLLEAVLKPLAGYELAMARKMPAFRELVATRIINRVARQNLLLAMASAIPSSIPWIGPVVGLLGVTAETIFITSNQMRMVLQLASVYEREMDVTERVKELLPVIGGAFGWRSISRQLIGFVPAVGPGVKGSIAYAGTRATGEAARWFYRTGTPMDPAEKRRVYEAALERGETLTGAVSDVIETLTQREASDLTEGHEPSAAQARLDQAETAATVETATPSCPQEEAQTPQPEAPAPEPSTSPSAAEASDPSTSPSAAEASDRSASASAADAPEPSAAPAPAAPPEEPAPPTPETEALPQKPPTRPKIDVARNAGRRKSRKGDPPRSDDAPTGAEAETEGKQS